MRLQVQTRINPYADNVQGKANEPITVAGLLDRARSTLGLEGAGLRPDWTLEEIYDRLEHNAPRIAIIGGSPDHPAHILDHQIVARAALRLWQNGAVPFHFSTPVLCDGTAQSTTGMMYSLQSRNAVAEMVVNQMEAHIYHGAYVIQGCDKQPLGVLSALAHLDRVRRWRGEAPVWATFNPAHVLKGGSIPEATREELEALARRAEAGGHAEIAEDIRDAMSYILQCSSNTAFQGVLARAEEDAVLTPEEHKALERALAVATCDSKGGICAFHGTGNSSRDLVAGLGLVHPALEFLTEPPTQAQVNAAVDALCSIINRSECSVSELVRGNIANAIRIHSSAGGSTNLVMHIVGLMQYAGYNFSLEDLERIHTEHPVPDLFDYSLTEGRDIFALAQQCCSGQIRGMETLFYELMNNGVPMHGEALTVTGSTWSERLSDTRGLSADGVRDNPIILSRPRRAFSGVDVLRGNFFDNAVVKISGMSTPQLDKFDDKVAFVLYYENEDSANASLLDTHLLERLKGRGLFPRALLLRMWEHNAPATLADVDLDALDDGALFEWMARTEVLKIAIVVSGQGPEAFGMPEMFTPMQHINANRHLQRLATLISDGRYSGVSYGAAIGHMTPEAIHGGGILYLQDGDLLQLRFRAKRIELLDPLRFAAGEVVPFEGDLGALREAVAAERMGRLRERQRMVAASNRMTGCTDAARGVVPLAVAQEATDPVPYSHPRQVENGREGHAVSATDLATITPEVPL